MVSIVMPVAREGKDLYDRVRILNYELKSRFASRNIAYEIILVSDIFHRPTMVAMIRLAREGVAKCLFLSQRIGKGGSVKNAILYTRGDYIVLLDADIPVSVDILCRAVVLAMSKRLDLLIANRVHRSHSLMRYVLSIAYNSLVNLLFRTSIKDHQAGFKILSRRAARIILLGRTRTDGLAYDTEVIVWTLIHRLRYGAIDVVWREQRLGSTILPLRALLTMMTDLITLRLITFMKRYIMPQKLAIGRVIELKKVHIVGSEFITMMRASGLKKYLLDILRKLYITVAFGR